VRRRKPDLLFVLAVILGCGIAMTSYGSGVLNTLEHKQVSFSKQAMASHLDTQSE
jgi:hypothetical protein